MKHRRQVGKVIYYLTKVEIKILKFFINYKLQNEK